MTSSAPSKTLGELALIASSLGWNQQANTIIEGLEIVSEGVYPLIVKSVHKLNSGQVQDAIDLLQNQALKQDSGNVDVLAILALAFKLNGYEKKSQEIAEQILAQEENGDTQAGQFASALLKGD